MARRNIDDYSRVLSILETAPKDKDGWFTQTDIESIFVALTDKVRPETIKLHIDMMCNLKLLIKRGELSYKLSTEWKDVIKRYSQ